MPIDILKLSTKNLLAYSAGIDSSALFYILLENGIKFDIALVNYQTRSNSNREEAHAHALAKRFDIKCHSTTAPKFPQNFEKNAREFRYNYFEELVTKYKYDTIVTAHQLNDQLEWLLMRFVKGAGVSELVGLKSVTHKDKYQVVRPLLSYSKQELLDYLHSNEYQYFVDESNSSDKYERNRFRKKYADPLMQDFTDGIRRSFEYIAKDKDKLESGFELLHTEYELKIIKLDKHEDKEKATDLALKELGYLMSASQRKEVGMVESLVIGGKWAVEIHNNLLYISPFCLDPVPKKAKDIFRTLKIPIKIRPYCFINGIDADKISPLKWGISV